jgi:hypothetical protein
LLRESLPARLSITHRSATRVVLSGTRNGTAFYQRVSFSCGGRKINSRALLFPATEKATYKPS